MGISLVMFTERGERRTFPIDGDKAIIGRTGSSDIQIPLAEISRRQCEVEITGDKLTVRDLGSSNGTYVNNKRVQEAALGAGETLTIGPVIFTVVVDGKPTVIKPIRTILEGKKKKKNGHKKEKPFVEPSLDDDSDIDLDKIDLDDSAQLEELAARKKWKDPVKELEAISRRRQQAAR